MALTDWVQTGAAIYFAWQQNRIFRRQNEIFAAQSEKTAVQSDSSWILRVRRYWPTLIMLVLIGLTAYDIYDRHHARFGYDPTQAWDDSKPLERVYPRTFTNETVVLDGKHFIDPKFDNVTFFYGGTGGVQIDNPKYRTPGVVRMESNNKVVATTITLATNFAAAMGCNSGSTNMGPVAPSLPPEQKDK
jgi:hypothetical protein